MSWMQRLKRDLNIDIEVCEHYGGQVKVIASIEDPKVIELIFKYLKHKAPRLMPPDSANCHQGGHHHWLPVCSTHLTVVSLIKALKAYTASFTAAGRAADIQCASSQ